MERHFFGLIIKTNVAYLPLKRHLFYPVFFYNIDNVIILTYFVKLGITDLGALTVKLYQNIATLIEEFK